MLNSDFDKSDKENPTRPFSDISDLSPEDLGLKSEQVRKLYLDDVLARKRNLLITNIQAKETLIKWLKNSGIDFDDQDFMTVDLNDQPELLDKFTRLDFCRELSACEWKQDLTVALWQKLISGQSIDGNIEIDHPRSVLVKLDLNSYSSICEALYPDEQAIFDRVLQQYVYRKSKEYDSYLVCKPAGDSFVLAFENKKMANEFMMSNLHADLLAILREAEGAKGQHIAEKLAISVESISDRLGADKSANTFSMAAMDFSHSGVKSHFINPSESDYAHEVWFGQVITALTKFQKLAGKGEIFVVNDWLDGLEDTDDSYREAFAVEDLHTGKIEIMDEETFARADSSDYAKVRMANFYNAVDVSVEKRMLTRALEAEYRTKQAAGTLIEEGITSIEFLDEGANSYKLCTQPSSVSTAGEPRSSTAVNIFSGTNLDSLNIDQLDSLNNALAKTYLRKTIRSLSEDNDLEEERVVEHKPQIASVIEFCHIDELRVHGKEREMTEFLARVTCLISDFNKHTRTNAYPQQDENAFFIFSDNLNPQAVRALMELTDEICQQAWDSGISPRGHIGAGISYGLLQSNKGVVDSYGHAEEFSGVKVAVARRLAARAASRADETYQIICEKGVADRLPRAHTVPGRDENVKGMQEAIRTVLWSRDLIESADPDSVDTIGLETEVEAISSLLKIVSSDGAQQLVLDLSADDSGSGLRNLLDYTHLSALSATRVIRLDLEDQSTIYEFLDHRLRMNLSSLLIKTDVLSVPAVKEETRAMSQGSLEANSLTELMAEYFERHDKPLLIVIAQAQLLDDASFDNIRNLISRFPKLHLVLGREGGYINGYLDFSASPAVESQKISLGNFDLDQAAAVLFQKKFAKDGDPLSLQRLKEKLFIYDGFQIRADVSSNLTYEQLIELADEINLDRKTLDISYNSERARRGDKLTIEGKLDDALQRTGVRLKKNQKALSAIAILASSHFGEMELKAVDGLSFDEGLLSHLVDTEWLVLSSPGVYTAGSLLKQYSDSLIARYPGDRRTWFQSIYRKAEQSCILPIKESNYLAWERLFDLGLRRYELSIIGDDKWQLADVSVALAGYYCLRGQTIAARKYLRLEKRILADIAEPNQDQLARQINVDNLLIDTYISSGNFQTAEDLLTDLEIQTSDPKLQSALLDRSFIRAELKRSQLQGALLYSASDGTIESLKLGFGEAREQFKARLGQQIGPSHKMQDIAHSIYELDLVLKKAEKEFPVEDLQTFLRQLTDYQKQIQSQVGDFALLEIESSMASWQFKKTEALARRSLFFAMYGLLVAIGRHHYFDTFGRAELLSQLSDWGKQGLDIYQSGGLQDPYVEISFAYDVLSVFLAGEGDMTYAEETASRMQAICQNYPVSSMQVVRTITARAEIKQQSNDYQAAVDIYQEALEENFRYASATLAQQEIVLCILNIVICASLVDDSDSAKTWRELAKDELTKQLVILENFNMLDELAEGIKTNILGVVLDRSVPADKRKDWFEPFRGELKAIVDQYQKTPQEN